MKSFTATCLFLLWFGSVLQPAEKDKVAFVEFQNKAGTIITTNRWTMAEDLAKTLRKKNNAVQTVSRKEILKRVGELKWGDDRLNHEQEAELAALGARYVVYGTIAHWRIHGVYSNTEVQDASESNVIFLINVVDLSSGESIKSFSVNGAATGETGLIHEGDPADFVDETQADDQMYEATEVAINKAADILAETLDAPGIH
jgi:hypothetical protein